MVRIPPSIFQNALLLLIRAFQVIWKEGELTREYNTLQLQLLLAEPELHHDHFCCVQRATEARQTKATNGSQSIPARSGILLHLYFNSKFPISLMWCRNTAWSLNSDSRGLFLQLVDRGTDASQRHKEGNQPWPQLVAPLTSSHHIDISKKATPSTALFWLSSNPSASNARNIYACCIALYIYISEK